MVNDQQNEKSNILVDQIIEKVKGLTEDQQQYIFRQLQKFEFMERREYQRFRCDHLYVGFDVDGTLTRELVLDISEGGVFVKTKTILSAGQKVILTFADSDGRAQYRVNTTVVRSVNNGIALVFDADNQQQRLKIKSIMNYVRHVGYIIDE
jgi:hypothetical protein